MPLDPPSISSSSLQTSLSPSVTSSSSSFSPSDVLEDKVRCMYTSAGQSHLLHYYSSLPSASQKRSFLQQLSRYDPVRISCVFQEALKRHEIKELLSSAASQAQYHASIAKEAMQDTVYRVLHEREEEEEGRSPLLKDSSSSSLKQTSSSSTHSSVNTASPISSTAPSSSSSVSSSSSSYSPFLSCTPSSSSSSSSLAYLSSSREKHHLLSSADPLVGLTPSSHFTPQKLVSSSACSLISEEEKRDRAGNARNGEKEEEDGRRTEEDHDKREGNFPSSLGNKEEKEVGDLKKNVFVSTAVAASEAADCLASAAACTALEAKIKASVPAILHVNDVSFMGEKETKKDTQEGLDSSHSPVDRTKEGDEKENNTSRVSGVHTPESVRTPEGGNRKMQRNTREMFHIDSSLEKHTSEQRREDKEEKEREKKVTPMNGLTEEEKEEKKIEEASIKRAMSMPLRCCRRTCFPPEVITWREVEEEEEKTETERQKENSPNQGVQEVEEKEEMKKQGDFDKTLKTFYKKLKSTPCPLIRLQDTSDVAKHYWRSLGLRFIREGRVGMLVLAGGDGSRLGFAAPKGMLPAGPVSKKSIFQIFVERLIKLYHLAMQQAKKEEEDKRGEEAEEESNAPVGEHHKDGKDRENEGMMSREKKIWGERKKMDREEKKPSFPLYIMTSESNNEATRAFFEEEHFFGLSSSSVHFFNQQSLPVFSVEGQILLLSQEQEATSSSSSPSRCLYTAPNGNGAVFSALETTGILAQLKRDNIIGLQVCSIDNLLAKVGDPLFYGLCIDANIPIGNKVLPRRSPYEKVGVMCQIDVEEEEEEEEEQQHFSLSSSSSSPPLSSSLEKERGRGRIRKRRVPAVLEYSELPDEIRLATTTEIGKKKKGGQREKKRSEEEEENRDKKNERKLKEDEEKTVCIEERKNDTLEREEEEEESRTVSSLEFYWGNACLHYFSVEFIEDLLSHDRRYLLDTSYHLALKNIRAILPSSSSAHLLGAEGREKRRERLSDEQPSSGEEKEQEEEKKKKGFVCLEKEVSRGWKLELFIFDVFPFASHVLCVEVSRSEEFSPIKNKNKKSADFLLPPKSLEDVDPDTLYSAQLDLSRLHKTWLKAAYPHLSFLAYDLGTTSPSSHSSSSSSVSSVSESNGVDLSVSIHEKEKKEKDEQDSKEKDEEERNEEAKKKKKSVKRRENGGEAAALGSSGLREKEDVCYGDIRDLFCEISPLVSYEGEGLLLDKPSSSSYTIHLPFRLD
ncbi:utp-glucose-1-phosphate uridylyltransferase subfamily protein [Cystoisospora suis]|uniref:UDP-N-acetylglucosamine diphosphorylase n=1 Tax=Cystoisospora suis TaxID=483139 RepID=A0A2C6LED2_9APIC|nr:utp-glucose-1-phosphate uridylyltransferase subfamily protein [Cystoisospora suis]